MNSSLIISCPCLSLDPIVEWFKNEKAISDNLILNSKDLFIEKVKKEDIGTYKCKAKNSTQESILVLEIEGLYWKKLKL